MSDIEIVTPVPVNDIEFYVSNDGDQCGVSISGLGRLCGVGESSIRKLINYIAEVEAESVRTKPLQPELEPLLGKTFLVGLIGIKNAKIISAFAASTIIEFYAYESKAKNKTAINSFRTFARMGFELWVKQITGFVNQTAIQSTETKIAPFSDAEKEQLKNEIIREILGDVKKIKLIVEKDEGFQKATITLPGLRYQFDGYAEQGQADEEELKMLDSGYFTLDDWLKSKDIFLEHGAKCGLGRIVSSLYKVNKQCEPKKMLGTKLANPVKGRVTVYQVSDIPMLEVALLKYQKINN